jgi:hypothetical protein
MSFYNYSKLTKIPNEEMESIIIDLYGSEPQFMRPIRFVNSRVTTMLDDKSHETIYTPNPYYIKEFYLNPIPKVLFEIFCKTFQKREFVCAYWINEYLVQGIKVLLIMTNYGRILNMMIPIINNCDIGIPDWICTGKWLSLDFIKDVIEIKPNVRQLIELIDTFTSELTVNNQPDLKETIISVTID